MTLDIYAALPLTAARPEPEVPMCPFGNSSVGYNAIDVRYYSLVSLVSFHSTANFRLSSSYSNSVSDFLALGV